MNEVLNAFIREHAIHEIECVIPDMTGMARGKIVPKNLFLAEDSMKMSKAVLTITVNGEFADFERLTGPHDPDMVCVPDVSTIRMVPWAMEQVAVVIHDCEDFDGKPVGLSPRAVLRKVLALYAERGWRAVVAPEMEFYLIAQNNNSDEPLRPPTGRAGRSEIGRQSFSIDAVNDFDPFFQELSTFCAAARLNVETLVHEVGACQMEINFSHGDALELADQVFLFKRAVRETAYRHNIFATFMAKPMQDEPGSAMHIHQSVVDAKTGLNVFSLPDGSASELFYRHIGGMQRYLPTVMPMLAPYVNSYRRLTRHAAAPINVRWGYDNRTCGIRVPPSGPEARRVENRVPGVDVNPYLAMAATLACGYLGMVNALEASPPMEGSAYTLDYELPRSLEDAIELMQDCKELGELLGHDFVSAFCAVKGKEFETFNRGITAWEREHLQLHV
ncbi:glutamine synthetase family protein [Craterilacuibacter sp. RT1T]|uniref:glutamine synthetase family protein n=1 Tax=Craterilacuibacter sp. RT1T TaxID=2942211 RepID=UPI0020BE26BB|nr:glutamine synthetase family protein [Craterilacuibacter sp. RT1T]MCL6263179.1 glutamine synthetase family protein [Craterilacuibacter sp. RT1T]